MTGGHPAIEAFGTAEVGERTLALDITVQPGQVVALVGPNGAGKSTTLDVLLGLRALQRGHIRLAGSPVVHVDSGLATAPQHRRLGWVPQSPALLPRRRVIDQVLPFVRRDLAPLATDGPDEVLTRLGLDRLLQARPHELSGGQAQRVAVARAICAARVVLLDEATSAQDADGAAAVRSIVRSHVAAGGSCLVVSHRPEDAWLLADQAVVLDDLTPVQRGSADDLARRPATPYVAQAAGMTVLHGEVGDDHVLRTPAGDLVVPDATMPGPATAMVRPTAVTLHAQEPRGQSARNVVRATVRALEPGSAGLRVVLDGRPPLTVALTEAAARDLRLHPGDVVWATVKATDVEVSPR